MAGRRRISELAQELGVTPAEVLVKLAQMGEYVKSAASTIEAPVERRIRESFPVPAARTTDQVRERRPGSDRTPLRGVSELQQQARDAAAKRFNDPFDPLYVRAKVPPRGPYKGAKPSGLKRRILDDYIVPRNLTNGGRRPMSPVEYWANEVFEADEIITDWADLMFSGLSEDDMLAWMRVLSPNDREKAAALFAEGIDPDEIGFDGRHDFYGKPSLAARLSIGNITPQQAAEEIRARRIG